MDIYVKFYIEKENSHERFLFWACVLDTVCDDDSVDYKYLKTTYNLPKYEKFILVQEFEKYSPSEIQESGDYIKRAPIFLPKDESFNTGSPYKNRCAELTVYYEPPSAFAEKLHLFLSDFTDFDFYSIQKIIIKKIHEATGIDLIKSESMPGCISIYTPLPAFKTNIDLKEKIITVTSMEDIYDFCVEVEAISIETSHKSKILFKRLFFSKAGKTLKMQLPDDVEPFYTFRITVFHNDKGAFKCIYEESFHLVKSVSLGLNINSGTSKLLKNRFLGNKIEKLDMVEHNNNILVGGEPDFTDWDRQYAHYFLGKEKEYLESRYFFKNESEKKLFLEWIRSLLSDAKKVFLIDPFLSAKGFQDFISCYNSYFSLTVITTDPRCLPRTDDVNTESENLAEKIYDEFPSAQVYYLSKDALHDRYMIVESSAETRYYSFSNSWQGLLKNYSLLVQEMDYEPSLKLKNDYEKIIENATPIDKKACSPRQQESVQKKSDAPIDIEQAKEAVKGLQKTDSVDCIIKKFYTLFNAAKHWWEVTEDFENVYHRIETKKNEIIHELVGRLLKKEKKAFEADGWFVTGQKFSSYTKTTEIMERVRERGFCGLAYYDLKLDYAYYYLLSCFFIYDDEFVINELERQEDELFVFASGNKYPHFVSELIVSAMLCDRFANVHGKDMAIAVQMAKKTKYSYCRLYIAEGIYNGNYSKDFSEMIKFIEEIPLTDEEWICFLYSMYSSKIFKNCQTDEEKAYPQKIERYVHDKFLNKELHFILQFCAQAYLLSHSDLNLPDFDRFAALFDGAKKEEIIIKFKLFLLLYAVRKSQNNKLYDFFKNDLNIDKWYFDYIENTRNIRSLKETGEFSHKKNVVDISEFRSHIPLLAGALATLLGGKSNVSELCQKLIYKFDIHKNLITETYSYYDCGLDYFSALIILHSLYLMRDKVADIKKLVSEKIGWYVPLLLNADPNDLYGFSYSFAGLYFQFIGESDKASLYKKLTDRKMQIFCASMLYNQEISYIENYNKFLADYTFTDGYDRAKEMAYLLNVFVNLCLIDHKIAENHTESLVAVLKKVSDVMLIENNAKLAAILNAGIDYAKDKNTEKKETLLTAMTDVFFPYSALSCVEER